MPSCVIKGCKSYDTKVKKQHGISYHRYQGNVNICRESQLHQQLPNDMENYMEYHLMGSVSQVRMKPECMPHKFICQPDRERRTADTTELPYIPKKRRMMILEECIKDFERKFTVTEQSSFEGIAPGSSEVPEGPDDAELNSDDDDEEVERALYQPPASVALMKQKKKAAPEDPSTEASGQEGAATAGSSRLHAGYRCDQCRGDIFGSRYCCVECPNYDLCGACEAAGHHATHYVLRVPSDKPHVEVIAVLENIRNVLLQREDAENKCNQELEVKVEVPDPDPLAAAADTSERYQVEVIAEDAENKCGQEPEVKVEAPDPAPGPDPLAGAPHTSEQEEEKLTTVEPPAPADTVPPPEQPDMVVKLELDEGQLMMESFHTVPEPEVYSHSVRAASVTKSYIKEYSGGGGGGSRSGSGRERESGSGRERESGSGRERESGSGGGCASGSGSGGGSGEGYAVYTHSAARPAPAPVLQGSNVTQEKGNAASSAKRKITSPPQHAKVKKKLPSN